MGSWCLATANFNFPGYEEFERCGGDGGTSMWMRVLTATDQN